MLLWYSVSLAALTLDTLMELYMDIRLSTICIYCREIKFKTGNFVRSVVGIVQPRHHIRTLAGLLEGFELGYLTIGQSFVFCDCVKSPLIVAYHKRNFVRKILAVNQFDFSHNYHFFGYTLLPVAVLLRPNPQGTGIAALFGRKIVAVVVIPRQPDMVIMTGSLGQFDRLAPVIKSRISPEVLAPLAHPLVAGCVP